MRFLEYFYVGHPWYAGGAWGNVFVIPIVAGLGWLWSRTRFWPLLPIRHGILRLHEKVDGVHERLDAHAVLHRAHVESMASVHEKLDKLIGGGDAD